MAQVLSGAVGGVNIELDASRSYFFGHSQGSNVGVPALATTGLAKAAILSGAGSYLTEGLLTKTSPVDAGHVLSLLVGEPISNGHPIMTLWQTFFDRMDPVNFDPLMIVRPPAGVVAKHVHMTWGLGDTFSREPTLNITARGMGLANAEPIVTPINGVPSVVRPVSGNVIDDQGLARTAACYQYQSDGTYDGHFVAQRNRGSDHQLVELPDLGGDGWDADGAVALAQTGKGAGTRSCSTRATTISSATRFSPPSGTITSAQRLDGSTNSRCIGRTVPMYWRRTSGTARPRSAMSRRMRRIRRTSASVSTKILKSSSSRSSGSAKSRIPSTRTTGRGSIRARSSVRRWRTKS